MAQAFDNQVHDMDDYDFTGKLLVAVIEKYLPGRVIEITIDDLNVTTAKYAPDIPTVVLDFKSNPNAIGITIKPMADVREQTNG